MGAIIMFRFSRTAVAAGAPADPATTTFADDASEEEAHGSKDIRLQSSLAATAAALQSERLPQLAGAQAGKAGDPRVLHQERHKSVLESVPHRRREGGQGARREASRRVAPTKPDNIEEQTRLVEDWIVKKPDGSCSFRWTTRRWCRRSRR